jgi:hypothetical protein
MYPVTAKWKEETEQTLRNPSYVRIVFGVTDPDAPGLSTQTDNGHLPYSDVDSVDVGTTAPSTYQTLERNRFILDGKNPLPPESNPIYQGYAGLTISGDAGTYTVQPLVKISFGDYVQFPGLTFQFDDSMGDYPNSFRILAKKDSVSVFDKTYSPDTTYWEMADQIPLCNELSFYWLNSNIPHRRARLLSLVYGLVSRLGSDDIASCSSTKEIDLLSSKIPKQEFEFTLIDTQRRYDPENPSGLWEYLESRQPVNYQYGYELSDGSIEWIPWGLSYSTGDFDVSKSGIVAEVSIKCVGLADHLTMTYDEGVYSAAGRSLFDLATDVMKFAGFENTIELDNALKTIYTHNPLPSSKVNECLQLIANAGRCIMNHSRGGYIQILRENDSATGFDINFDKMTDTPTTTKIPPLRNLSVEYNSIKVNSEVTAAVNAAEVSSNVAHEYTFTHSAYTNQQIVLSSGLTMVGTPKYYAYKTVVTLKGTGTVTINGNSLTENKIEYRKKYSDVGEDLSGVSNTLIDNQTDAIAYANWVAAVTLRRNTYSAPDRGYPELDVGDSVNFTSNFANETPVTMVQQKLTYNGAIKGECQYIIGGGS